MSEETQVIFQPDSQPDLPQGRFPQVQIQITSESVLFLPLSFFTLGEYNIF